MGPDNILIFCVHFISYFTVYTGFGNYFSILTTRAHTHNNPLSIDASTLINYFLLLLNVKRSIWIFRLKHLVDDFCNIEALIKIKIFVSWPFQVFPIHFRPLHQVINYFVLNVTQQNKLNCICLLNGWYIRLSGTSHTFSILNFD